jgi:CheY-like chemotaxis protein
VALGVQKDAAPRPQSVADDADFLHRAMVQLHGSRVLLVEDNAMNQELAVELLRNAGVAVVLAQNGQEALDRLEQDTAFDAILMDCQMPVMDGYHATEQLRKRPQLQAIPVIAMTASVMDDDRERATRAGMVDYIDKPINVGQMFATLARWISPKTNPAAAPAPSHADTRERGVLPTLTGLDMAIGLATVMGNRDLYIRQLRRFVETYQDFAAQFAAAQSDADTGAPQRAAHTLRGIAGNLGALQVQDASGALELACKAKAEPEQIQALLQACLLTLSPLLDGLREFVAEDVSNEALAPDVHSERLTPLFATLGAQLRNGDPDAAETMSEVMHLIGSTSLAGDLRQVCRSIDNFDFEAAELELVRVLAVRRPS